MALTWIEMSRDLAEQSYTANVPELHPTTSDYIQLLAKIIIKVIQS
jgi:hypothetical protein